MTLPAAGIAIAKKTLWDWPVRICHWSIVLLVIACWWTAEIHEIVYHGYCAYALLAVVIFRIYWGFFGSSSARFSHFLTTPAAAWRYLKNITQRDLPVSAGHNPVGGYSAVALLLLLLVQIGLGLFAIDVDGFDGGPFTDYLSFKTARLIADWHEITFNILLGFIALHIVAIIYYLLWRRQNLTAAMLHGKAAINSPIQPGRLLHLVIGCAFSAGIVLAIIYCA
jgi:cytochrome b